MVPDRVAESESPHSENTSIVLADENTACVIDSYQVEARCTDRSGAVVGRFGRDGEAPGEFRFMSGIARGPDGVVGVVDSRLARFTVFRPGHDEPLTIARIPPMVFRPLGPFGDLVSGTYHAVSSQDFSEVLRSGPEGLMDVLVLGSVDVASGVIVSEEQMQHPSDLGMKTECDTGLSQGARGPSGMTAFGTCQSELVFLDANGAMTVIQAPTYSAEPPNERDIQQYKDFLRGLGGLEPSQEALAAFAETPKQYLQSGRSLIYDIRGWLWAATRRDRDRWSYLDVYQGTALLGSVRVRDRLVGFDILGSTLVTLVDRPTPPDMAADRGIDWYDLGRVIDQWGAVVSAAR